MMIVFMIWAYVYLSGWWDYNFSQRTRSGSSQSQRGSETLGLSTSSLTEEPYTVEYLSGPWNLYGFRLSQTGNKFIACCYLDTQCVLQDIQ